MLPDFRLETYFARWEFRARYHLSASDAETLTLAELLAMASPEHRAAWEGLRLGYTETTGTPALREAIAGTYASRTASDVLCFSGAQEGLFCAMHALLGADDHAIVLTPAYQSAEEVPLSLCAVSAVPLVEAAGWALDVDAIRDALRPNTRLIAINFPNNPTGAVPSRESFDALLALAAEHGLHVFSDEVYRGLEADPSLALPQVADVYPRGSSLNVMSKAYGLAGLRIGWIACSDRQAIARMEKVRHYLSICGSAPSELLATIALAARDPILRRNRGIVARNLDLLTAFMDRHEDRFDWYQPGGGCVAFPRFHGNVEELCRTAVEEAGVLLLPASIYQSRLAPVPRDRFRIGFGRANLPEALAAFEDHLERRVRPERSAAGDALL